MIRQGVVWVHAPGEVMPLPQSRTAQYERIPAADTFVGRLFLNEDRRQRRLLPEDRRQKSVQRAPSSPLAKGG
jgi:hypothetical protein